MNQEEKILELENRVEKLERELAELKSAKVRVPYSTRPEVVARAAVAASSTMEAARVSATESATNGRPTSNVKETFEQKAVEKKPSFREKSQNMESKIGKNLMGILASILIFLSVVLFGVLIYDRLADAAKVGVIFIISAIFTSVGLIKMKRENKYYVFFTSLAACGIGAFYILFMLMYFAYHMISDIPLAIVLFMWTVAVSIVARMKSKIFSYICYAGTTISVILCCVKWPISFVSLGFYLFSMFMIFGIGMDKQYRKNGFAFIQFPIMAMVLAQFYSLFPGSLMILLFLVVGVFIAQNFYFELDDKDANVMVITEIFSIMSMMVIASKLYDYGKEYWFADTFLTGENIAAIIFALMFIILVVALYLKHGKGRKSLLLIAFYPAVVVLPNLTYYTGQNDYIGYSVAFALLLVIGCLLDNKHFRIPGYVYLFLYILDSPSELNFGIIFAIEMITLVGMILWVRSHYSVVDKYMIAAIALTAFMMLKFENYIDGSVLFIILAIVSLCMNSPIFRVNGSSGEDEKVSRYIGYAFNAIMMIAGASLIDSYDSPLMIVKEFEGTELLAVILITLITIVLYFINVNRLFELKLPEMLVGVYICFKFTFLIFIILDRLGSESYVNSVVGLVVAIICIILGFKLGRKPYRLYGLVLTLICVAKLILFDVQYSSNLLRPVGFFFAGVLCFAISWIYSLLEKREAKSRSEEAE